MLKFDDEEEKKGDDDKGDAQFEISENKDGYHIRFYLYTGVSCDTPADKSKLKYGKQKQ